MMKQVCPAEASAEAGSLSYNHRLGHPFGGHSASILMAPIVAFLDYQVIDHLQRVRAGTYLGRHAASLVLFETRALVGSYQLWMSEISHVEMLIGREKPALDPRRLPGIVIKDTEKLAIAAKLGVRWLGYPASKLSDPYSRLGMSFRLSSATSALANELESKLGTIADVSPGDVRQVATAIHGFDACDVDHRPSIGYFVTEDEPLVKALRSEQTAGRLPELSGLKVCSVAEMVTGQP